MYDLSIVGNPLIELSNDIISPTNSSINALLGPCMTSADTAIRLGIDNMVLILSAPLHIHHSMHDFLNNRAVPEHYIIDAGSSRCDKIVIDVLGRKTQVMAPLNALRVCDIPDELFNTRAILMAPSFQETEPNFISEIRSKFNTRIFWNPQLYRVAGGCDVRIGLIEDNVHAICPLVDCVYLNYREYSLLTGLEDPLIAAEFLVEWGAKVGVVTLGVQGAVIFDGLDFIITPQYDVADTRNIAVSDVEDAFIAATTMAMLDNKDLVDVATLASAVGSLVIEQGHTEAISKSEVQRRAEIMRLQIQVK